MGRASSKYSSLLICGALSLITFFAFVRVLSNEFVNYDDDQYITGNTQVQAGLSIEGIKWAFTHQCVAFWLPLTILSHMLDCQLFGLNPTGHHLTSLLLHIVNTLLLFWFLKDSTGELWKSSFVAAAFALHPLHVESVAWAAERKDVLSTLFWLLTMAAYLRYVKNGGAKWYTVTLLLFALGLMTKPMLVTLPFVLLLLDYWPLGRLQNVRDTKRLSFEKTPFFVLSVISSAITFLVQKKDGAMPGANVLALKMCFANAVVSYLRYVGKMIWPSKLAVFYPYYIDRLLLLKAAAAFLVLLGVSILVLRLASRHRYLPAGWLWYLGTLVPVIGFVQVGSQTFADRYTYMPLTGLFIIIAWALPELLAGWRHRRIAMGAAAAAILSALTVCTWMQMGYWHNSIALFEHALKVTVNNGLAHYNIGVALQQQRKPEEAFNHYLQVLRINPNYADAHNNLGSLLLGQGKPDEAVSHFRRALELKPNFVEAYNNLGLALGIKGNLDEAISNFQQALRLKPDYVDAHYHLGLALQLLGKNDEAISHYRQALKVDPNHTKANKALQELLKNAK
jgi:tetratricopeptide (TPR) repeat protein